MAQTDDEFTRNGLVLLERRDVDLETLKQFHETLVEVASTGRAVAHAASSVADASREIARCVQDCVRIRYEFELNVRQIDASLTLRREKLLENGPLLRRSIEQLSDRIDRVLDKALAIDTAQATVQQLQDRARLLETVDRFSESLTDVLARLVSM